jgi:diguanylate cyclase (GGDEF)-like protein
MLEPPPYPREAERLATLRSLNLLDTPIEQRFERITRMVCRVLDVPIAHFNLLDEDRQHLKSVQGLCAIDVPLGGAFCTHAILEQEMLVIPDASKDVRFWDNPFVTGHLLDIRFYAGCPIKAPNGLPIGTLCAIDTKPRDMPPEQLAMLRDLADMLELELCVSGLNNSHAQLVAQLDAAARLARIDCLTRLWNRTGIHEIIDKDWAEAERHGRPLAFVVADLDHFKSINDTYGHQVGDAVISMTAKVLLATTRGGDSVGRLGGEEFLAVLTSCAPSTLFDAVERLRTGVLHNEYVAGGTRLPITISCGAAVAFPRKGMDWSALVKKADDALYAAKRQGRNRSVIDDTALEAAA